MPSTLLRVVALLRTPPVLTPKEPDVPRTEVLMVTGVAGGGVVGAEFTWIERGLLLV